MHSLLLFNGICMKPFTHLLSELLIESYVHVFLRAHLLQGNGTERERERGRERERERKKEIQKEMDRTTHLDWSLCHFVIRDVTRDKS